MRMPYKNPADTPCIRTVIRLMHRQVLRVSLIAY
jgi:hypothetical protein